LFQQGTIQWGWTAKLSMTVEDFRLLFRDL
jgi:hypothetical protein